MGLPKKIKKHIQLDPQKTFLSRRYELADKIAENGTFLPKSLLHADLDRGMLDFIKEDLKLSVTGKDIPVVDILLTTQNWSQFTETWNFQDLDKNAAPPFISVVRSPEVKFGTNPALLYNIPNRKQYHYAVVPTWDGQRSGADIYKIPQPVPVDITYSVKIICNRMRELNKFNQIVLEKFASRQAYRNIKGHYIPIVMTNISDESVMDVEKRKYYVQSYEFVMLGFLIDEDEFEISPAISRQLTMMEVDENIETGKQFFSPSPSFPPLPTPYPTPSPTPPPVQLDSYVTGFTLNLDTITLSQNRTDQYSAFTISLSAFTGIKGEFLPLSGGTVTGETIFNNGLTANTISATTYLNLPVSNFTGGTVSGSTNFTNGLTTNTISATTYQNLPQSATTFVTAFTYNNNTFTIRDSSGSTFNATINTVTGLTVNGVLTVTGNTFLQNMTGRTAFLSASTDNVLTVVGSGSCPTTPIFSVVGSQGELFSVTDSLQGLLFSVNDISGLPTLEVYSDDTILMGSYYAPSLNTTKKVTLTAGTNTIYSIPISAYTGGFFEYTLMGSTGARAGSIMSIWSGTTSQFTEVTTNDIGSTTGVTFNISVVGNNAVLSSSATTNGWTLKTIIRSI